jgi:hypothetical protein
MPCHKKRKYHKRKFKHPKALRDFWTLEKRKQKVKKLGLKDSEPIGQAAKVFTNTAKAMVGLTAFGMTVNALAKLKK